MNGDWSPPDEGLSALLDRQSERIVLNAAELQVSPGETARFPFAVTSGKAAPSLQRLQPGRAVPWRRWSRKVIGTAGAVVVAGGVAALISAFFTFFGPGPALQPQAISFTSVPPGYAKPGTTYHVAATGGRSGNPVAFAIDPSAASVCSVTGPTVAFKAPGTCVIDANQSGNADYQPAPQAEQTVTVNSPIP